jgi:hypothetical protein
MSKKDHSSKPARKPGKPRGKKTPLYQTPPILFLNLSVIPSGNDTSLAFDLASVLRAFFGEERVLAAEVTDKSRRYSIMLNEEGVKRLRNALCEDKTGEEECRKY